MTIFTPSFEFNERFYMSVAASTSEESDYVPANGEKILIINMGISSSTAPDTVGCICWDADGTPELLMSSYNEAFQHNIHRLIIGDGVKIMRIVLTNDLNEPTYMGGYWQGVKTT